MMKRIVLSSAALLVMAVPAFAGHGEKCSATAQACLNHWAAERTMGWVGLEYDKSTDGIIKVKSVMAGSPAADAGFQSGDILVALNGAKMSDKEAMKKAKGSWKAGQSVTYTVERAGAEKQIAVTLATAPDNVFAAMVGSHMLENHAASASADAKAASMSDKK